MSVTGPEIAACTLVTLLVGMIIYMIWHCFITETDVYKCWRGCRDQKRRDKVIEDIRNYVRDYVRQEFSHHENRFEHTRPTIKGATSSFTIVDENTRLGKKKRK